MWQGWLAGGVVALLVILGVFWLIVDLAKKAGRAGEDEADNKAFEERRHDADEVLAEPVADEAAWLAHQEELAARFARSGSGDPDFQALRQSRRDRAVAAAESERTRARKRLRELQRRSRRGPGTPPGK